MTRRRSTNRPLCVATLFLATWLTACQGVELHPIEPPIATSSSELPLVPVFGSLQNGRLDDPLAPLQSELRPLSSQSCAAAGCHGGARPGLADPQAVRGEEYNLWLRHDPHARSLQTLGSDESRAILQKLGILQHDAIVDPAGYANCVACHGSLPDGRSLATPADVTDPAQSVDTIGCAACHGPAEQWINQHYQRSAACAPWKLEGLIPLNDWFVRARVCASCHVGDRFRDMNHDIIAAGHPPLRYEFATYYLRLPKHWRDEHLGDLHKDEARLWLAGQLASLDASLALLEGRTSRHNQVSTWPEFSEYECASCHHDQSVLARPHASGDESSERLAPYSTWHRTGLTWALATDETASPAALAAVDLTSQLEFLGQQIESSHDPSAARVRNTASRSRAALWQWVNTVGYGQLATFNAHQLCQRLSDDGANPSLVASWEAAVSFYLAAVAGRAAWHDPTTTELAEALQATLRYPAGKDQNTFPRGLSPQRTVPAAALQELLESLGKSLGPSTGEVH